jgi:hypothetical protein
MTRKKRNCPFSGWILIADSKPLPWLQLRSIGAEQPFAGLIRWNLESRRRNVENVVCKSAHEASSVWNFIFFIQVNSNLYTVLIFSYCDSIHDFAYCLVLSIKCKKMSWRIPMQWRMRRCCTAGRCQQLHTATHTHEFLNGTLDEIGASFIRLSDLSSSFVRQHPIHPFRLCTGQATFRTKKDS